MHLGKSRFLFKALLFVARSNLWQCLLISGTALPSCLDCIRLLAAPQLLPTARRARGLDHTRWVLHCVVLAQKGRNCHANLCFIKLICIWKKLQHEVEKKGLHWNGTPLRDSMERQEREVMIKTIRISQRLNFTILVHIKSLTLRILVIILCY